MTYRAQLPMASSGCSCCAPESLATERSHTPTTTKTPTTLTTRNPEEIRMNTEQSTTSYLVTGMTCGHCASAVSSEINQLPGVTDVNVDLVAGGTSTVTVTSGAPLSEADITTALDEAGDYHLAQS